ncbi:hypothetical protein JTE90_008372 [Oedothorax gibbosus]|uniref:Nucleolar protein 7 n=1 Tax=Oedothorax gibbosus TaxID=931172 RepID=A0AAV6V4N8_9ARAC|nr:hypothetical protein JTE90_008372 [Oedothorax gibbosus]
MFFGINCKAEIMSLRMQAKLDAEEDKILLPQSSEDEEEEFSEDEQVIKDPFASEDDSDSDDAPDALSFKEAFEDTKSLKRQTVQVIRTQQEERRKKRREIHDQYMLQKEQKRLKVDEKKLPDDIFEDLKDDKEVENLGPIDNEKAQNDADQVKEVDLENVGIHGATVFKCKVLPVESKKPRYIPQQAASFKDNLLYGGRIRREKNAREAMLKTEKQKARLKCH